MAGIILTPEQAAEAIHNKCHKRFKQMTEVENMDAICVEAIIEYTKEGKSIKLKPLPIIINEERYEQFLKAYGSEYMFDEVDKCHRRIFWFKYKRQYKSLMDMFKDNIEEIYASFRRLDNKKIDTSSEGGILTL